MSNEDEMPDMAGLRPTPYQTTPLAKSIAMAQVQELRGRTQSDMEAEKVLIDYTNHEGKRAVRTIWPMYLRWGSTPWHPEEQWLLDATDIDKVAGRTFAMKDIHRWGVHPDRQMRIDLSIARQLQESIERNGRMVRRLQELAKWTLPMNVVQFEEAVAAILRDQEPTWPQE